MEKYHISVFVIRIQWLFLYMLIKEKCYQVLGDHGKI